MGAELSEFELDEEAKKELEILHKDESLSDMFERNLREMTDVILQPRRMEYDNSMLCVEGPLSGYCVTEFTLQVNGSNLHAAKWIRNPKSEVCIVYLHTNGRALVDAPELLPVCNILDANLFSFDMPGCGKSDGCISLTNVKELSQMIDEIASLDKKMELILWGRGLSSYIAVEYASQRNVNPCVKFLVLDSPFTSVGDIVMNAASTTPVIGDVVPTVFVKFALKVVRNSVRTHLGLDPYVIRPVELAPLITLPCFILSADDDQFIPEWMGEKLTSKMHCEKWFRSFPGEYDTPRDECLCLAPVDKILRFIKSPIAHHGSETEIAINETSIDISIRKEGNDRIFPLYDCEVDATSGHYVYKVTSCTSHTQIPIWKDNADALQCAICNAYFNTLLRWKHHCRNCGECICDSCSKSRQILTHFDCHTPVRVCDTCMLMNSSSYQPESGATFYDEEEKDSNLNHIVVNENYT